MDEIYYAWDDRRVLCAVGIDNAPGNGIDAIFAGMQRAADRGEVIQLYAHAPGVTVPVERIEAILAKANELGLAFYTSRQLVPETPPAAGLALSFDDNNVGAWYGLRDLFDQHDADVTFFVSRYGGWDDAMKAQLRELAARGHSIQAHSVNHLRAPLYVSEHGLAAYMADEALPSIELLVADGYPVTDYAYPFGARTSELDHALLEHVERLRAVSFSIDGPLVTDPCPE